MERCLLWAGQTHIWAQENKKEGRGAGDSLVGASKQNSVKYARIFIVAKLSFLSNSIYWIPISMILSLGCLAYLCAEPSNSPMYS